MIIEDISTVLHSGLRAFWRWRDIEAGILLTYLLS